MSNNSAQTAYAATSSTLNFQGRLYSSSGNIVPDGYYNIQFKLYDGGTDGGPGGTGQANAGTNLWTESYYDSNGVTAGNDNRLRVVNGYFSANLGSQTAFGAINWDQELWLTMNVGGTTQTATPTYDGEMLASGNTRTKLTGVPYAFRAGELTDGSGNGYTADDFVQLGPSSVQGINSANTAIRVNQTGAGNILQLQSSSTDRFVIENDGDVVSSADGTFQGGDLTVGAAATAGNLVLYDGSSNTGTLNLAAFGQNSIITIPDPGSGSDTVCLQALANCAGSGDIVQDGNSFGEAVTIGTNDDYGVNIETNGTTTFSLSNTGAALFKNSTNSTSAFQIQNAAGTSLLNVDTSTNPNLITNPSFEINTTGWSAKGTGSSIARITTQNSYGVAALQVDTTGTTNAGVSYSYALNPSTTYTFSVDIKSAGSEFSTVWIGRQDQSGTDIDCTQLYLSQVWKRFSCSFTTGGTISSSNIYIKDTGINHTFYVDAAQLEVAGYASAFNQGGSISLGGPVTGPTAFTGPVSVGNNAGPNFLEKSALSVNEYYTDTIDDDRNGLKVNLFVDAAASSSGYISGNAISVGTWGANAQDYTGAITGQYTGVYHAGSGTVDQLYGSLMYTDNYSSGSITDLYGYYQATSNYGTGDIQNSYGLYVESAYKDSTGDIVNNYGIYQGYQSAGNNNYALYFAGATNPILSVTGEGVTTFRNNSDSAAAFQIQNAAGSQLFNIDTSSSNLIANPSMEVDATGWVAHGASTVTRSTSQAYIGNASLQVATTAAANDGAQYAVSLSSTTSYSLLVWVRHTSGSFSTFELGRSEDGSTDTSCSTGNTSSTAGWVRVACTFTTGTVSGSPYIYIKQTDATSRTMYIDAVQLLASSSITPYREGDISLNGVINSPTVFQNAEDSSIAFQIQNAAGTSNLFIADTRNGRIGIGTTGATAVLHISATGTGGVSLFKITDTTATAQDVLTIADGGAATFRNQTDSTTAFQIQNAAGDQQFLVNTSTGAITIGDADSTGAITLGQSTATNTISIGSAVGGSNTQTINIGTSATASSTTNINIGSTIAGLTTLQSQGGVAITTLGTANTATYLCRNASNIISTCNTTGAGAAFFQGGNTFGATAVLGTNDSNSLTFETNNVTQATIAVGGATTFRNSTDSAAAFKVQTAAGANVLNVNTTNSRVAVGLSAATTVLDETLNVTSFGDSWGLVHTNGTVQVGTYVDGLGGWFGTGTNHALNFFTNNQQAALIIGTNGSSLFKNNADSATGFQIQNANGDGQLVVNTSTGAITIGDSDATGTITLGRSTATNTISIGSAVGGSATQTINIGTSATASSTTNVNIGSTIAGLTTLQSQGGVAIATLGTANTDTVVCRNASNILATCSSTFATSTTAFFQGGNNFSAPAILGTNDANSLSFETGGNTQATIAVGGATTFQNSTNSTSAFQIQNAAGTAIFLTDTTNARVSIGSNGTDTGQLYVGGQIPAAATGSVSLGASQGPINVFSQGRYIYVTDLDGDNFKIVDVSDPASPSVVSTRATGTNPVGIYVAGRYAYVANRGSDTLTIYDVSNPSSVPAAVGSIATDDQPYDVFVSGRYAYVVNDNTSTSTLRIYDITNPSAPTQTGTLTLTSATARSVYVQGRYAYVVTQPGIGQLEVIDISNPSSPTSVSTENAGAIPYKVMVKGRYAYISKLSGSPGIEIYDISDPASPTFTDGIATDSAIDFDIQGRYLYITNFNDDTLEVIDIADPTNISSVGTVTTGTNPRSVTLLGRYAYVANYGSDSIQSFDVGGAYIQQLETGGIETNTLNTSGNASFGNDVNVSGGLNVSGSTLLGGQLGVNGPALFQNSVNSTTAFQIQNAAGNNFISVDTSGAVLGLGNAALATTVNIGNTTGATALNLQAGTGNFVLNGVGGTTYTIGAATTTGTTTIGGTAQTGTITLGSSSGTNSVLIGNGAGATTVDISNANTAGAVNIGSAFTTGTISIGGTGAQTGTISLGIGTGVQTINLATGGTGAKTLTIGSTASTSSTTINSGTGNIDIGTTAQARTTNVGTGAAAQTVNVGSTNTTSATTVQAGTGGLNITTQGTGALAIGNNAVAQTIAIGNTTGATALNLQAGTGNFTLDGVAGTTYTLGAATTTGTFTLGGTAQTGNLVVGQSTATNTLNLGNGATGSGNTQTINIGANGAAGSTTNTTIGSTVAGTTAIRGATTVTGRTTDTGANTAFSATNGGTGNIAQFLDSGSATAVLTVADGGASTFRNQTNSASAFNIQNAAGNQLFNVDSTNSRIEIGDYGTPTGQLYIGGITPTAAAGSLGAGGGLSGGPDDIAIKGTNAYIASYDDSDLDIVDITDPTTPDLISSTDFGSYGTNPEAIAVSGNYAYLAMNASDLLVIVDISNPIAPAYVSSITTGDLPRGIIAQGRYVYVLNRGSDSLQVFDVSNPTIPRLVGTASTGNEPNAMVMNGSYIYVANYNAGGTGSITAIDIGDPTSPTALDTENTAAGEGGLAIAVSDRWAYVTTDETSMYVFDIENPSAIGNVTSVFADADVEDLEIQGRYLYGVSNQGVTSKLITYDVSDPALPVGLSGVTTGSDPYHLEVVGRYAYVTNYTSDTLQTFDIGGAYIQQLETGGVKTSTIDTVDISISNNAIVGGNFSVAGTTYLQGSLAVGGTANFSAITLSEGATRTIGVNTRSTNAVGSGLTISAGGAGAGGSAFAGGALTLQGGAAGGTGNATGGAVTISGGAGTGTGVQGLVNLSTTAFSSASTQSFAVTGSISAGLVDQYSTIPVEATASDVTVTIPVPHASNQTVGRLLYISAVDGSEDFTITLAGTLIDIVMKENSTATLIWNGTGWTAAGASSSTDLQSAYNNTISSAGGAELVLNAPGGAADGLTIRNNATTPITGGLLEVQTSIGSNLFTVNNNATEYATNGGAETAGASASTFPASTWDATTGGTVDRYTTAGDNVATGQASVRVQTTSTNHGARNRISSTLTSGLTYTVSFAVRGATNFSALEARYSPDGTTSGTTVCATAQTVTSGIWTRISCSFVASGTINSSNSILIRQTDATARTFYIDNLSINVNASATYASDGSVDVALGSNWTAFGTLDNLTRDTSVIYDTSGSVNVDTPNNADRGVRNNLSIAPAVSTQYLVTFYARSSNTFNDIRVRYTRDGGTNFVSCVDYNTQSVSTTGFTEITCLFTTDSTTATNADLVIDQPTGSDRNFYIDALTVTLNTNNSNNVQIGGGNKGGPATLFTLDRSSTAPIAANNDAYLGSMYYDTTTGRIQCYEADGWGACGAAPDNYVNLNPEYAGAVLNGSGVGTMTADICSNDSALTVNDTLCDAGEAKNYYQWTSPQATQQTYSIYVSYQLPATFNGFASDDTVQLVARTDSTSNAAVTYEMFKSTGSAVTQCGTGETTVVTVADQWQSVGINGNEATGCSFNSSSAGDFVIFKINVKANSSANAYVSTLSFTTTGR